MEKSFCEFVDSRSYYHIYIDLGKQKWIQICSQLLSQILKPLLAL